MQNPAVGFVCFSQPTLGQRGGTNGIAAPPAGATSAPAGAYVPRSRPRSQQNRGPPSEHSVHVDDKAAAADEAKRVGAALQPEPLAVEVAEEQRVVGQRVDHGREA